MTPSHRSNRAGFTLVELLVVIGIIALLVSILLPALTRARQSAEQVKCLSNLKQIANATIQFTVENKGRMPTSATFGNVRYLDSRGSYQNAGAAAPERMQTSDFIAWRTALDPLTGGTMSSGNAHDMNITWSALAKYLGTKPQTHSTPQEAIRLGKALEAVFRCPGDNLQARPNSTDRGPFRFSYSMNKFVAGDQSNGSNAVRSWGTFTGKITSIKRAAEIVMFICEDELTLDDGNYNPNPYQWASNTGSDPAYPAVVYSDGRVNAVSSRHQKFVNARSLANPNGPNKECLGNVGFCDGSARFSSRKDALRQRYTGAPYRDPLTGF